MRALASIALLGSSAALAQPYGNGRDYNRDGRDNGRANGADYSRCYDQPNTPPECVQLRQRPDFQAYHDRNGATIINWINDPATGMSISEQQYLARYPWSNPGTWSYEPTTNLWVDHTAQNPGYYYPQGQNDRGRGREREPESERERNRDRN